MVQQRLQSQCCDVALRLAAFQVARRRRPAVRRQTFTGTGDREFVWAWAGAAWPPPWWLGARLFGQVVDAVVVAQGAQPGVARRRRVVELDLAYRYSSRDALRVWRLSGSAFSAEVVVSAAVLVDFGGDFGGGGERLLLRGGRHRFEAREAPAFTVNCTVACGAANFDPDAACEVSEVMWCGALRGRAAATTIDNVIAIIPLEGSKTPRVTAAAPGAA